MVRRFLQGIVVPIATFVVGMFTQALLRQYLTTSDIVSMSLLVIMVTLLALILIGLVNVASVDRRLELVDVRLADLAGRAGLRVEYVEDHNGGESYRRTARLIEMAQTSLTFVDLWGPFEDYTLDNREQASARSEYYAAVKTQISRHLADRQTFHRRIVQVPTEFATGPVPFDADPVFFDYLRFVTETQERYPNSCRVKFVVVRIRTQFIIVDWRYIIMPILTSHGTHATRHGAIVFDDREGGLVRCLRDIYQAIDVRARPLHPSDLEPMPEPEPA